MPRSGAFRCAERTANLWNINALRGLAMARIERPREKARRVLLAGGTALLIAAGTLLSAAPVQGLSPR